MKKLATLIGALLLLTSLSAKVVYVTTDGNNSNDGSSWDKAVADIQTAYTKASAGDEIWMAGGTYVMQDGTGLLVDMKDGVNVYGGFAKGDASIDARVRPDAANKPYEFTNATIFTSNGATLSQRPFGRSNTTDEWTGAILDGLVFKDLVTSNGKLLFLQTGVTMQNCIVKDCGGNEILVYFEGNGLIKDCLIEGCFSAKNEPNKTYAVRLCASKTFKKVNSASNVIFRNNDCIALHIYNYAEASGRNFIKDCTFDGNKNICLSFKNDGTNTPTLVDRCLFQNNKFATAANTVGEGNVISGKSASAAVVMNSIIRNNENTAAADADIKNAVVVLNDPAMRMVNCLVQNNKSARLSVLCGGHMINNTIVNNVGSISAVTKSSGSYVNNIFVNNTPTEGNTVFTADTESGVELVYNAIAESDVTLASSAADGRDYISGVDASSFVNPTTFIGTASADQLAALLDADFSLASSSPCINAGDYAYAQLFVGYIDGTEIFDEAMTAFNSDLAGNNRTSDNGKISLGAYQGPKASAIENIKMDAHSAVVYGSKGSMVVEVEGVMNASIYNITGSLIKTVALNNGENTISVPSGLYLVKVGNAAYKVVVR